MKNELEMNWMPSVLRWRKFYRKKEYWWNPKTNGFPPTKEESAEGARQYWLRKKAEIDASYSNSPDEISKLIEIQSKIGDIQILKLVELLKGNNSSGSESVGFYIDRFVNRKAKQAQAEAVSIERVDKVAFDLGKFKDWYGSTKPISSINLEVIEDYYSHLLEKIAERKQYPKRGYSASYSYDLFAIFLSLLKDLDSEGVLVAPKKIFIKNSFPIRKSISKNLTIPVVDIQKILSSTIEEKSKLYILLALNCAFYQKDIASLRQDEVNWKSRRIVRKRSKTSSAKNAPVVSYRLWDSTFSLLKKFRSDDPELVLLNKFGNPLRAITLTENNRGSKTDAIKLVWQRVMKKLKMKHKFCSLRKTSADLVHNEPEFRQLTSLFLAHAPRSVAEKHYVNDDVSVLDAAILWMEKKLGIDKLVF